MKTNAANRCAKNLKNSTLKYWTGSPIWKQTGMLLNRVTSATKKTVIRLTSTPSTIIMIKIIAWMRAMTNVPPWTSL